MLPEKDDRRDRSTGPYSREVEDRLDATENLARTPEDVRRVDHAFVGGAYAGTLLWMLLGFGIIGGTIAVATLLFIFRD
jgi:hypothetical protein